MVSEVLFASRITASYVSFDDKVFQIEARAVRRPKDLWPDVKVSY